MHVNQHTQQNNETSFSRKLLILSCFLFTGFCFWKAGAGLIGGADAEILPSAQAAVHPSFTRPQVVTTPIQEMRPGMRVVGRNPLRIQTEATIDPTPEGWRLVSVRMLKEDGTYFEAELLRPLSWIRQQRAQPGATILLNMPEMYVVGAAEVLSISACPPIDPGDGPVVLSTFKNVATNVLNISVEGETEPIGVTAGHPIWSEDRQAFIHSDQLQPGERLRSALGKPVRITSIEIRAGPEPVYNLEVAGEHVYSVTDSGLLVHNSTPCNVNGGTPAILDAVDEVHTLSMRDNNWRELAKSISGDRKAAVYVVRSSSSEILKVGKATTDNATSLIQRFRHYQKAGELTGLDVYVDVFKFNKSKNFTIQAIEKEIHTNFIGQQIPLRWSNEGQRLGRVGPGEPGKYSSRWFKKGYRWLGDEGKDNWNFSLPPSD